MPENHSKLIPIHVLEALKIKYKVVYDIEQQAIFVKMANSNRSTRHDIDKPFHINSKSEPKRKVCFNLATINAWLEIASDPKNSKYTIFDVQNARIALKSMYQSLSVASILAYMKAGFTGIKRV